MHFDQILGGYLLKKIPARESIQEVDIERSQYKDIGF